MSATRLFMAQLRRDLLVGLRAPGDLAQPLGFQLMVATLFPLGISPDPDVLVTLAAGATWITALLATLLTLDGPLRRDHADGSLEAFVLGARPLFVGVLARMAAHWLLAALPLVVLSVPVALALGLPGDATAALFAALLLGTPVLVALGSIAGALTVGVARGGVLLSLLVLPLYIPVLVFGTAAPTLAAAGLDPSAPLLWLAAMTSGAITLAPFAAAAALRISLES